MPSSLYQLEKITGGMAILDACIWYDIQYVNELFLQLGDKGKALYFQFKLLDMIYPLIYGMLLSCITFLLTSYHKKYIYKLFLINLHDCVCQKVKHIVFVRNFLSIY